MMSSKIMFILGLNLIVLVALMVVQAQEEADFSILNENNVKKYLSFSRFNALLELGKQLDAKPEMKEKFEQTTKRMGEKLMEQAVEDTDLFFGETKPISWSLTHLDIIPSGFRTGCELDALQPICNIVCTSTTCVGPANGHNLVTMINLIKGNPEGLAKSDSSTIATNCKETKFELYPFHHINRYKAAGFLDKQKVEQMAEEDPKFNFYYHLVELCEMVSSD